MINTSKPKLEKLLINGKWDKSNYVLSQNWYCYFEDDEFKVDVILLLKGFITDGGSIPWWYEWRLNPVGKYLKAYLVHDILYATELIDRATADAILRAMMKAMGANRFIRNAVYAAVRIGGGSVWKYHTIAGVMGSRDLVTMQVINKKKHYK